MTDEMSDRARLALSLVPERECEGCGQQAICVDDPDLRMRLCRECRDDMHANAPGFLFFSERQMGFLLRWIKRMRRDV